MFNGEPSPKFQDHELIVPLPAVDVSVNVTVSPTFGVVGAKVNEAVGEV